MITPNGMHSSGNASARLRPSSPRSNFWRGSFFFTATVTATTDSMPTSTMPGTMPANRNRRVSQFSGSRLVSP
jgi:hypothetical protein